MFSNDIQYKKIALRNIKSLNSYHEPHENTELISYSIYGLKIVERH